MDARASSACGPWSTGSTYRARGYPADAGYLEELLAELESDPPIKWDRIVMDTGVPSGAKPDTGD